MADESLKTLVWRSQAAAAVTAVLGLLLVCPVSALLVFLEHKAIQYAASLEQGASLCRAIVADRVEAGNEGQLVHVTGQAGTAETLADRDFGVEVQALRLVRVVETFQWQEEKSEKKKDAKSFVTYTYKQVWSTNKPAQAFADAAGHLNPPDKAFPDAKFHAAAAKLGAFVLTPAQVERIPAHEALPFTEDMLAKVPAALKPRARVDADGALFVAAQPGHGPDAPQVGDARIRFQIAPPQPISVVARQTQNTFAPFGAEAGEQVDLLRPGTHDARAMFEHAQTGNQLLTWVARLVGFVLIAACIATLVRWRVSALAGVAPDGIIANAVIVFYALVVALPALLLVISMRWLIGTPLIGAVLCVGGGGLLVMILLVTRFVKLGVLAGLLGGGSGRSVSKDARELFARVAIDPDDAELRLDLANTLTRNGDPMGELICISAELEPLPEGDAGRAELEDRAYAIVDQHGRAWFAGLRRFGLEPLVAGHFYPQLWMHNGVIDEVLIDRPGILPEQADALFAAVPGLRIIGFHSVRSDIDPERWDGKTYKPRIAAMVTLSQMQQIGVLKLNNMALDNKDLKAIATSPHLENLRELELGSNSSWVGPSEDEGEHVYFGVAGAKLIAGSATLQNLRVLDMGNSQLGDKGVAVLAAAANLAQLRSLNLAYNGIGPQGAAALAESPHFARLQTLILGNNAIGPVGAEALAESKTLAQLTELDLADNAIGAESMGALAKSAVLARVKSLKLANNEIGGPGLRLLARSTQLGRVEVLQLETNEIDEKGAAALAQCPSIKRLRELSLSYNKIGDAGLLALAGATALGTLKKLLVRDNHITAEGIAALAESAYLDELEELDVSGNAVGLAGARALAASPSLAKLKALWIGDAQLNAKAEQVLRDKFGDKVYP